MHRALKDDGRHDWSLLLSGHGLLAGEVECYDFDSFCARMAHAWGDLDVTDLNRNRPDGETDQTGAERYVGTDSQFHAESDSTDSDGEPVVVEFSADVAGAGKSFRPLRYLRARPELNLDEVQLPHHLPA